MFLSWFWVVILPTRQSLGVLGSALGVLEGFEVLERAKNFAQQMPWSLRLVG